MKVFLVVLGIFALALVVLLVVASTRPDEFTVKRSINVHASRQTQFEYVNGFHAWPAWSPWAKLDPDMQTTFSGSPSGVGAKYSWSGNSKVGAGAMELVESVVNSR